HERSNDPTARPRLQCRLFYVAKGKFMEQDTAFPKLVPAALVFEGGLAVLAWLLGWLLPFKRPPLEQFTWESAGLIWGVVAALPLLVALVLSTRYPIGPFKRLKSLVRELIVPMFRGATILDFAIISLVAGVGEEMLFRGVVQEGLLQLSGSDWLAIGLASLLFGLVHPISLTYALLAMLIGA